MFVVVTGGELLFFHRHGHRDRFQRVVGGVAGCGDDLIQHFDAAKDFPEHGVAPVESAVISHANKELRAVVVEVARAVALARHLRHRDGAAFVRAIARFGGQKVAGTAGPVRRPVGVLAEGVAALNEKAGDDTVKSGAVEETHLGKIDEILDVARGIVGIEADLNLAELRDDRRARILLLKLHSHSHAM